MDSRDNKMDTITLIEIFLPQLLAEAESARVSAEQALRNVEAETAAERAKMAERYDKLRTEIPALNRKIQPLQECIRMKSRTDLDDAADKAHLEQAQELIFKMEAEFKELGAKFRPQEERTKELIAQATLAVANASESENAARGRIGKAIAAHEAYQANPAYGVGPMPKFKTLREAVKHFYKIGFSLSKEGGAREAYIGDLARTFVSHGEIGGMMPESIGWLGRFEPFKALPCPGSRSHIYEAKLISGSEFSHLFERTTNHNMRLTTDRKMLCFIEETGKILASHTASRITMPRKPGSENFSDLSGSLPRKQGTENFSDLFGSWEDALTASIKELSCHGTLDLKAQGNLPMLGELVREAWEIAASGVTSNKVFPGGQGRLSESKINDLIGPYWRAFIDSPWEPSINGTYALLKHRCARGEIPNVYAFDIQGHFGFRVRTPDHDWIIGEIYCPPENYSPTELPDSMKLINHAGDEDWFAELGPVKFLIRGRSSRS